MQVGSCDGVETIRASRDVCTQTTMGLPEEESHCVPWDDVTIKKLERKLDIARVRAASWKAKYEAMKACIDASGSESDEDSHVSGDSFLDWIAQDNDEPMF